MMQVFVVMKEGTDQYYLLKVEKRGFDVYCFLPDLGIHHSLRESGESHFSHESKATKPREQPPVALVMGEAGTPTKNGIKSTSLRDLGRAAGICIATFSIDFLIHEFRKFKRSVEECFVIDKASLPKNTSIIEVGVWAVPERNKPSFEFNNPDIPENLLHKVVQCEPQIWIFARPFV